MRLSLTDEKFLGLPWEILVIGAVAGIVAMTVSAPIHTSASSARQNERVADTQYSSTNSRIASAGRH
jgi:hypothetical protein